MGSEAIEKISKERQNMLAKVVLVLLILQSFSLMLYHSNYNIISSSLSLNAFSILARHKNNETEISSSSPDNVNSNYLVHLPSKQTCDNSNNKINTYETKENLTGKPIWFNMYESTIPDEIYKGMINPLTNTKSGAKSFYVQSSGLRQCLGGNTLTVTCSNIHPIVPMREGSLDIKFAKGSYHHKYILALRNPMYSLYVGFNGRQQKYHSVVGQASETTWKTFRDQYFEQVMLNWKNVILEWKQSKYNLGFYLVYEDLLHYKTGQRTLHQLALFLAESGFDVPVLHLFANRTSSSFEDAISCIWYDLYPKARSRQNEHIQSETENIIYEAQASELLLTYEEEFPDYFPSYTETQKNYFVNFLWEMVREFHDDLVLVDILNRYIQDIQVNIRIDEDD